MKRQVFISPKHPNDLFPEEKFEKKNEIYYNDDYILISYLDFFVLMTILELETDFEQISKNLLEFIQYTNSIRALNFEKTLDELKPNSNKLKRIAIIDLMTKERDLTQVTDLSNLINGYLIYAKDCIEITTKRLDVYKKPFLPYLAIRSYSTKRNLVTKTRKEYRRVGVLKTLSKNLNFVKKTFLDYNYKIHLDIIIIYIEDDKNIFLSIKEDIGISAIEVIGQYIM